MNWPIDKLHVLLGFIRKKSHFSFVLYPWGWNPSTPSHHRATGGSPLREEIRSQQNKWWKLYETRIIFSYSAEGFEFWLANQKNIKNDVYASKAILYIHFLFCLSHVMLKLNHNAQRGTKYRRFTWCLRLKTLIAELEIHREIKENKK